MQQKETTNIAEAGVNHKGNIELAKQLIEAAAIHTETVGNPAQYS